MSKEVQQAGAVVVTLSGGAPRVLLVTSSRNSDHWVLPKGHVEAGETAEEAAVREAFEEAGVRGRLLDRCGAITFSNQGRAYRVDYFLLVTDDEGRPERGRKLGWFSYEDAIATLSFENSRTLLAEAWPAIRDLTDDK